MSADIDRAELHGARSTRGVVPGKQQRSRQKLVRIVDATERLMVDREFDQISVLDICIEADVSASSFYARFVDKAALLEHVHDRFLDRMRADLEAALSSIREVDGDLDAVIHALTRAYGDYLVELGPIRHTMRRAAIARPDLANRRVQVVSEMTDAFVAAVVARFGDDGDAGFAVRVSVATHVVTAGLQAAYLAPVQFADAIAVPREEIPTLTAEMWLAFVDGQAAQTLRR